MKNKNLRKLALALSLTAAVSAFSSCGYSPLVDVVQPSGVDFDNYEARRNYRNDNAVTDEFLADVRNFSYKSAQRLFKDESLKNQNYSPLSLYYALAMAAEGAKGNTKTELCQLLGISDTTPNCEKLYRLLTSHEYEQLIISDSIWSQSPLNRSYADTLAKSYYAECFEVDFADESTAKNMSDWVSQKTKGLIKPDITVAPETVLSILNTVYFKAEWIDRFESRNNTESVFHTPDGDVTATFLNSTNHAGFEVGDGFTRASLSFKGNSYMTFVLPNEDTDIQTLLETVGVESLLTTGEPKSGIVHWSIPKFEFASKYDLNKTLQRLGMTLSFTENADFSEMLTDTPEAFYIGSVTQESKISLDENGVTAAAFTNISYSGAAAPIDEAFMTLDRPFLYAIYSEGIPLFIGITADPTMK